jgi:hypothetical protein
LAVRLYYYLLDIARQWWILASAGTSGAGMTDEKREEFYISTSVLCVSTGFVKNGFGLAVGKAYRLTYLYRNQEKPETEIATPFVRLRATSTSTPFIRDRPSPYTERESIKRYKGEKVIFGDSQ